VVDSSINVLYVDGYPRWEYRYIKNAMIRDSTVNISCLLTSADVGFAQEGDDPIPNTNTPDRGTKFPGPVARFPESIEEMLPYDVVLFGDVDPLEFTDRQLQLVVDFVEKRGGGFGMIAGPKWSPLAFRNSPLEAVLPVNVSRVQPDDSATWIADGFRPVLTPSGEASTIFRFFTDVQQHPSIHEGRASAHLLVQPGSYSKKHRPGLGRASLRHRPRWAKSPAPGDGPIWRRPHALQRNLRFLALALLYG